MNPIFIFWTVFSILSVLIIFLSIKYKLLNDMSMLTEQKPYSFARTQLAWWTVIILSSFIAIIICRKDIPTFNDSTIELLTISAGVLATATLSDISDQKQAEQKGKEGASPTADPAKKQEEEDAKNKAVAELSQNQKSQSFLIDILSDKTGISIHRLQTVIFNIVFGCWFIRCVLENLPKIADSVYSKKIDIDKIMPVITQNNLILLGVSAGTYVALKTGENKSKAG